jgi:hypothetical protein
MTTATGTDHPGPLFDPVEPWGVDWASRVFAQKHGLAQQELLRAFQSHSGSKVFWLAAGNADLAA